MFTQRPILTLIAIACGAGLSPAHAAQQVWNDGGPSDIWNTSALNWDAGVAWTNGNNAVFNAVTGETVTINGTVSAAGLTSNYSAITLSTGYTIAGATGAVLDLSGTGGSGSTAKPIISSTGTNTISANIQISGSNTPVGRVVSIGSGNLTLSGNISETGTSKGLSVGNSSGGVLTLAGNNSFTGGVTLSNSNVRLNINSATALGTGGLSTGGSPATIDNTSGSAIVLTANNNINLTSTTVGSTSTNSLIFAGANNLSFGSGVLTMTNSNKAISVTANTLSLGGIAEDATPRSFFKNGAGTLVLSGASSYTGNTTISAGSLRLGNGSTGGSLTTGGTLTVTGNLTVDRSNTATQGTDFSSSAISGAGSITQAGTGSTVLNAANTYTGGTTVTAGSLLVSNITGSGTGTGGVAASGSGVVGGSGTIAPTGTNGLSFATGSGVDLSTTVGTNLLTMDLTGTTGSATFATGSTFKFDLAASNQSDVLAFTGLNDASVVAFNLNGVTVTNSAAGTYTLFTFSGGATQADNYSGLLSGTVLGLGGGQTASFIYNTNSIQLQVVPEPSTYVLLLGGLASLAFLRRGRRQRA